MGSRQTLCFIYWMLAYYHLCYAFPSSFSHSYETHGESSGSNLHPHFHVVVPSLVDHHGRFLSHDVTLRAVREHQRRTKRDINGPTNQSIYYHLPLNNSYAYYLNVTANTRLMSSDYQLEVWGPNHVIKKREPFESLRHECYFHGHVLSHVDSRVAISNCHGLHGVVIVGDNHFIIEPARNFTGLTKKRYQSSGSSGFGFPHVLHRSSIDSGSSLNLFCGTTENKIKSHFNGKMHKLHKKRHQKDERKHRHRRSTSVDRFVETLVVTDPQMVLYHGEKDVENYILTLMNIPGLEISHHAGFTLNSFCHWQASIRPNGNKLNSNKLYSIPNHDNAVLITRHDICFDKNEPCDTLGLAEVSGMCEPERSCSVTQDIGLVSGYTIAHEMGHNFGMQHDGTGNPCKGNRNKPGNIMATQLSHLGHPLAWSKCSRQYITDFLDSGFGACLLNQPPMFEFTDVGLLPGEGYNADDQCRAHFGPKSSRCKKIYTDTCKTLWCSKSRGRCITNFNPMLDGTRCNSKTIKKGWCYNGVCVPYGTLPQSGDGTWGEWSDWSTCSRTCGGGVQSSERLCNNPRPIHGGRFCTGERKKYRTCNTQKCPSSSKDYRLVQCSEYNKKEFRGKYYKWIPFNGVQTKPCALFCQAVGFNFYLQKSPKVADGTRCYADSLDVCINGQCMNVGCDGQLGSSVPEDRCRVCGGDGSSCQTKRGQFTNPLSSRLNTYVDVVKIPKGSVHILITELNLSKNFLALKSSDGTIHINGKWEVSWPAIYEVAGTRFHYLHPKNSPESLRALGPTTEDLTVMLLLQEINKGIRYEFNYPHSPISPSKADEFEWSHLPWSECTKSCAKGISIAEVICIRKKDKSRVMDAYCPVETRPSDKDRECNVQPCEPEWSVGVWSECSVTCGGGQRERSVLCIQKLDHWEEKILDDSQCALKRPLDHEPCSLGNCPNVWYLGKWSECSPPCGKGLKKRAVVCFNPTFKKEIPPSECSVDTKPNATVECKNDPCLPSKWVTGSWTKCNTSCGLGKQNRTVECKDWQGKMATDCFRYKKPLLQQVCYVPCKETATNSGCKDINKAGYCHLVLKLKYCSRPYFRKMCCRSCASGTNLSSDEIKS